MNERSKRIHDAADYLSGLLGERKPEAGIILGSGLGRLADYIEDSVSVSYKDIPGFPEATAVGHEGRFICGYLRGKCVIAMKGRYHYYEGYPMDIVTLPVRVMTVLGIKRLFVSNAAGCTSQKFDIGDIMIIKDHINLQPNPLIGPNLDEFGARFPDMTRPYDLDLIKLAKSIAADKGIKLREGVYIALTGPTYETPAEYGFCRAMGADAVGMSTVPEVIVARHASIPCFGVSVITDLAHEIEDDYTINEQEVIVAADKSSTVMSTLFSEMIASI